MEAFGQVSIRATTGRSHVSSCAGRTRGLAYKCKHTPKGVLERSLYSNLQALPRGWSLPFPSGSPHSEYLALGHDPNGH